MHPEILDSTCVVDVSTGAGHPMINCSLHCDQLCVSIMVSAEKGSFFDEGGELRLSVSIRIMFRIHAGLVKWQ